jgi:hypothetical protein
VITVTVRDRRGHAVGGVSVGIFARTPDGTRVVPAAGFEGVRRTSARGTAEFSYTGPSAEMFGFFAGSTTHRGGVSLRPVRIHELFTISYQLVHVSPRAGEEDYVHGYVSPPPATGERLLLQRYVRHRWTTVTQVRLGRNSWFRIGFTPPVGTTWYRLLKPGDGRYETTSSRPIRIRSRE